jgi:anti-sigma B factor antagonist
MRLSNTEVQDGLLIVRRELDAAGMRVALLGELDLANVRTAESVLQEALDSGNELLVDLAKLEFIDSTGLSLLVMALRRAEGRVSFLPSDSESVRRLLSLTGPPPRMPCGAEAPTPATGVSPEERKPLPAA